ncbi:MAG: hypothetical protein GX349_04670, partial [Firmicutes bacterium]|nr:hypothetical protein [Bacillota bacterium]
MRTKRLLAVLLIFTYMLSTFSLPVGAEGGEGELRLAPSRGSKEGGEEITITCLSSVEFEDKDDVNVWFGEIRATVNKIVSKNSLEVITPPQAVGEVVVTLEHKGVKVGTGKFSYLHPPLITDVDPLHGPVDGGTPVIITGAFFIPGEENQGDGEWSWTKGDGGEAPVEVLFGNVKQEITKVKAGEIHLTTVGGEYGPVDITVVRKVKDGDGYVELRGRAKQRFTYTTEEILIPTIEKVSPNGGPSAGGNWVEIKGSSFASAFAEETDVEIPPTVMFGNAEALQVRLVDRTLLLAQVPENRAGGFVTVGVRNHNGGEAKMEEAYYYKPKSVVGLKGISPAVAPLGREIYVEVKGVHFPHHIDANSAGELWGFPAGSVIVEKPAIRLEIGEVAAGELEFKDTDTLIARAPSMEVESVVDVVLKVTTKVQMPGEKEARLIEEEARLEGAFSYKIDWEPPEIEALENVDMENRPVGPKEGGSTIRIIGRNFRDNMRVFFGSVEVEEYGALSVESDGKMVQEVTLPPSDSHGLVTVWVYNEDGTMGFLPRAFTYLTKQLILTGEIYPTEGPVTGGTQVEIWGQNLGKVHTVTFGGQRAEIVTQSAVKLVVKTPPYGEEDELTVDIVALDPSGSATLKK